MSSHSAGATPDPIPNSLVKPGNADDTGGTGLQPVSAQVENLCHQIKEMVGSAHPTWDSGIGFPARPVPLRCIGK